VLAVVLLAVVAPPLRVDKSAHSLSGEGAAEHVQDLVPFVDHGQHRHAAEHALVGGLAPAFRVEGRPVEHHRRPALMLSAGDDPGFELEQIGIVAVQALGQGARAHQSGAMFSKYL